MIYIVILNVFVSIMFLALLACLTYTQDRQWAAMAAMENVIADQRQRIMELEDELAEATDRAEEEA